MRLSTTLSAPSLPCTRVLGALVGSVAAAAFAPTALAHGSVPEAPPTVGALLLNWTFSPLPTLAVLIGTVGWLCAVGRANRGHPRNPVPRSRTLAWLGAMAAFGLALASGIEHYDTTLFSVHMAQHILLTLVVAPLLALAAPVTLLLRISSPGIRRAINRVLHSRAVRFLAFPVTAWILFAAVMWATHFSALFDAALEDPLVHDGEHALFLVSALLFWWPAVGLDPAPFRMSHPARIGYVFLQMTQNTFLSVVLLNVPAVLYPHYGTLGRPYGLDPLADQRLAAGVMWLAGDAIFLGAIMLLVASWMRAESRGQARSDRQAETERAGIRIREQALAERLARERGEPPR